MKLASVLYLANQEIIGYPVDTVVQALDFVDELHLLAGDEWSFDYLKTIRAFNLTKKIFVHMIEHPIKDVAGIPSMMERAIHIVRDRADFILVSQADTVHTDESKALVRSWMKEENLAKGTHTYVRIGFLYQNSQTGWGNTIVGRDFRGGFHGDGSGHDEGNHAMDFIGDINTTSLEIGSLSVDHYYRHQKNHHVLWNERWLMGERLDAYAHGDREEFIRLSLKDARFRIRNAPLEPIESVDPRFTKVIDDMGLRSECEHVNAMVKKYGFDQ